MKISIQNARKKIGKLIDLASQGEEIILTRRGKEEAKIISLANSKVHKNVPQLDDFRKTVKPKGKPSPTSKLVTKEREERW